MAGNIAGNESQGEFPRVKNKTSRQFRAVNDSNSVIKLICEFLIEC